MTCYNPVDADQDSDFTSAILDTMATLVVVLDRDWRIVRFNRACELTTGYRFDDLRGKDIRPLLIPADETEDVGSVFGDLLAGRFPNQFENDWVTRDGLRRRIAWSNTALRGASGAIDYVIGTGIDITARKQAEEALCSTQRRLELTVSAARMGIFDRNVETGVVIWSSQLAKLFGLNLDQFAGTFDDFIRRVHADDRARVTATIQQAVKTGEEFVFEYRVVWPDASVHWLESRGRLFHMNPDRVLGTIIDITDRKIHQEQLISHREQLQLLASQLSLTEEKERRRIAVDLHDSIGQNLALARLKLRDPADSRASTPSVADLRQARELIDQALLSVHSLTYELSPPILYDLGLEAALEWLGEQIEHRHGLKVVLRNKSTRNPIREELRILLFRAARELLINVVKHACARHVTLSLSRVGPNVELIVEDDGRGCAKPLSQASADGTGGFGLFSIRERLEHFGGRLAISTRIGEGTRATAMVPLEGSPSGSATRAKGDRSSS